MPEIPGQRRAARSFAHVCFGAGQIRASRGQKVPICWQTHPCVAVQKDGCDPPGVVNLATFVFKSKTEELRRRCLHGFEFGVKKPKGRGRPSRPRPLTSLKSMKEGRQMRASSPDSGERNGCLSIYWCFCTDRPRVPERGLIGVG